MESLDEVVNDKLPVLERALDGQSETLGLNLTSFRRLITSHAIKLAQLAVIRSDVDSESSNLSGRTDIHTARVDTFDYPTEEQHERKPVEDLASYKHFPLSLQAASVDTFEFSLEQQDDSKSVEELASDEHCSFEVQDAVLELHSALYCSWPTTCSLPHQGMLRLAVFRGQEKSRQSNDVEFDVAFSAHCQKWAETRFAISKAIPTKGVRFSDQSTVTSSSTKEVDVCQIIEASCNLMKYVRVIVCSNKLQAQKKIVGQISFSTSQPRISLKALSARKRVKQTENFVFGSSILSEKHKAVLAVILAYSLWNLSKGAWGAAVADEGVWLQRKWLEEGFYFLLTAEQKVDIARPYLPIQFKKTGDNLSTYADINHPSPSIFAFGMLLIDLQCRKPFLDLRKARVQGEENDLANTDYAVALELLETDDFKDNVNIGYQRAINACLRGSFIYDFEELHESEVQKGFFQEVIMPLKQNLIRSWHLSPDNLSCKFEIQIPGDLLEVEGVTNHPADGKANTALISVIQSHIDHETDPHVMCQGQGREGHDQQSTEESCLFADSNNLAFVDKKEAEWADNWFRKLSSHVHPLTRPEKNMNPESRIKIAILDTGIELPMTAAEAYDGRIVEEKSWLKGKGGNELDRGDRDLDGHGTHCASVLLKVANNAAIYVARVFRGRAERGGYVENQETLTGIANAINYAVTVWKVHIITLSFGCKRRVNLIYDAIKNACDHKVLVFAAASNCGGNDNIAWPASMKDHVICVHATDGNGNATGFSPNALISGDNFAFPGSAILSYWPEALGQSEMRMHGTSCAAPIAAGIAAIVLEFIRRIRPRHPEFDGDADTFDRSKERLGMSHLFHRMVRPGTKSRSNYAYIEPWLLFNFEGHHYDEKDVLRSIWRTLEEAG